MATGAETRIDLLRHGEPLGGSRYRGQLDDELSERGWRQMWHSVGERDDWQQIVTSPLLRCSAFAEALGSKTGLPVQTEPRFMETGFGAWEGKTRAELEQRVPGQVVRFYRDPVNCRPPGAEPLSGFTARVQAGLHDLLQQCAGQAVLVVTHAGVIRAVLAHVLEIPVSALYRIQVGNATLSRICTDRDRSFTLVFHGVRGGKSFDDITK